MDALEKIVAVADRVVEKVFQFLSGKSIWKYGYLLLAYFIFRNPTISDIEEVTKQLCSYNNLQQDVFMRGFMTGSVIGLWLVLLVFEMLGKLYNSIGQKK